MATIIENLKKILEARYGKDVRQAIHDSIENCYNDGKAGSIDLQARHDIEEMGTEIATVESIAKGKNQARVFSTTESMENWLSDSANKGVANVGDNLYIVAVDVPDWWISSVLDEPNESGMYYEIAQLETQKVDLTTIESAINSIDSKIGSTDISAIGDGTVTGGLDSLNSNLQSRLKRNDVLKTKYGQYIAEMFNSMSYSISNTPPEPVVFHAGGPACYGLAQKLLTTDNYYCSIIFFNYFGVFGYAYGVYKSDSSMTKDDIYGFTIE